MAVLLLLIGWGVGCWSQAAERVFDFSREVPDRVPAGFRSAVSGQGEPGDWRVILETANPAPTNLPGPVVETRRALVAQLARDPTDEHFPLLYYEGERFADFTFTVRVRLVAGEVEQMAGLVFRVQDERNYYVLRLSAIGNTARFYKFVDGVRSTPLGVDLPVARGVWHELGVECRGNQIRCLLDGKLLFPPLTDNSFTDGYVGFWTKSDSVSHFTDARVVYTPREALATRLVRQAREEYPRLLAVRLSAARPGSDRVEVLASSDAAEVGQPAGPNDTDSARNGNLYYGKEKKTVSVVLPVRDRNGDPVAAVRLRMDSFPGQTQDNALVRARPIVERMERQIRSARDLVE